MINFKNALSKLLKRKKKNGYYESDYILTPQEKQSLVIGLIIIAVPIVISSILLLIN